MGRPYAGVYEMLDFPEYQFQEYPKVMGYRDAAKTQPITVASKQEEDDFIAAPPLDAVSSPQEQALADLERELAAKEKRLAELESAIQKANAVQAPVGGDVAKSAK
jgi:hypothetical protein